MVSRVTESGCSQPRGASLCLPHGCSPFFLWRSVFWMWHCECCCEVDRKRCARCFRCWRCCCYVGMCRGGCESGVVAAAQLEVKSHTSAAADREGDTTHTHTHHHHRLSAQLSNILFLTRPDAHASRVTTRHPKARAVRSMGSQMRRHSAKSLTSLDTHPSPRVRARTPSGTLTQ